jgi:hypothetical protein
MTEDGDDINTHIYSGKEVQQMRGIAYHMAEIILKNHWPGAKTDSAYRLALLQYAESLAQTYINAGVRPDDFKQELHKVKKQS